MPTKPVINVIVLTHTWNPSKQRYDRESTELPAQGWSWDPASRGDFKSVRGAKRSISLGWKNGGWKGSEVFTILHERFVGREPADRDGISVSVA